MGEIVSGAAYKIDTFHLPHNDIHKWGADIYRLSDDSLIERVLALTEEDVIEAARSWIKTANSAPMLGTFLYVDEDGNDALPAPAGHSVKA